MGSNNCTATRAEIYIRLPRRLIAKIDALLHNPFRGKREYGRRNELVENLLELWVRQEEGRRGVTADALVRVIEEQKAEVK